MNKELNTHTETYELGKDEAELPEEWVYAGNRTAVKAFDHCRSQTMGE